MKRPILLLVGAWIMMGLVFTAYSEEEASKTGAFRLPASLDSFFPPKAQLPVFLLRMIRLGNLFSGVAADLAENDIQGAREVFEKFKSEYVEISKMVPEWQKAFSIKTVEELGEALKLGDPGKVMPAFGKAGAVCHECHVKYMPLTQHRRVQSSEFL